MKSRRYWSAEDTKALLSIWAEERVQLQFDGVCRKEDVIKYIVAELAKLSINRTTLQVREKIKKLRAQYKAIKTHNGKSGAQRKNFPWFDLMDGVLGHRGETSLDTMAATVAESSSQRSVLFNSEMEQGPSTLPLITSIPERHDEPEDLTLIGGSHIPQRTRPESHKRKAVNLASREFLQCMQDITQQQMKEERELRREEMMMRREELDCYAQLRREEMSQRQKESESLAAVFSHLTAVLDSEMEQGPSTLPLITSTPMRHDDPEDLTIRGGSHIPQRTRRESRKRKTVNLEFLQCLQDITQQQMKEERELRREEMTMRREELDCYAQLRREMSQRQKESESFAAVFSHLTAALLQRK